MEAMNWRGSKEAFIESVLASGRPGTQMPTWSENFGGPLRNDQIENVAQFVLNYETEELCAAPLVTYDWQATHAEYSAEFPEGDPVHGEELFLSYGCTGCHGNLEDEASALIGPWLGNIEEVGATRVEGLTADEYVYQSILDPNAFIVPECPTAPCAGPPSAMPNNFALRMAENPQDLQDIMSYLLGE
jgi:mono/diheme cytochrome c family protein